MKLELQQRIQRFSAFLAAFSTWCSRNTGVIEMQVKNACGARKRNDTHCLPFPGPGPPALRPFFWLNEKQFPYMWCQKPVQKFFLLKRKSKHNHWAISANNKSESESKYAYCTTHSHERPLKVHSRIISLNWWPSLESSSSGHVAKATCSRSCMTTKSSSAVNQWSKR